VNPGARCRLSPDPRRVGIVVFSRVLNEDIRVVEEKAPESTDVGLRQRLKISRSDLLKASRVNAGQHVQLCLAPVDDDVVFEFDLHSVLQKVTGLSALLLQGESPREFEQGGIHGGSPLATGSQKRGGEPREPTTLAERTTTMPRDITNDDRNPAGAIKARYDELMAITDAEELSNEAFRTVAGTAFSKRNRASFNRTMQSLEGQLDNLRFYLTNFVLKAGGDGVI